MPSKKPTLRRSPLDFVAPGRSRGEIRSVGLRSPEVVEELTDNPDGGEPIKVLRRLPGVCASITLQGSPFTFDVRVVEKDGGPPQIVDLRIRGPVGSADVPITRPDLQALSLSRLAAAAGSGLLTSSNPFEHMGRWQEPEKHTASSGTTAKPKQGKGRPSKITPEFLETVASYAREARDLGQPINAYVAARIEIDPKKQPRPETVKWYVRQAREAGFLQPGELRGKRK